MNRIDRSEDHPEIVVELGHEIMPFLQADGLSVPPPEEWVVRSRANKAKDAAFLDRMLRNGGTLPPSLERIAIANAQAAAESDAAKND